MVRATKLGRKSPSRNHPCTSPRLVYTSILTKCHCRWYNVPPDPSKKKDKGKAPANGTVVSQQTPQVTSTLPDGDSEPIDFNTYVPSHDPSLAPLHPPSVPGPDYAQYFLPPLQGPVVSQDEAFQRALSAMYWGGYWTAMYHVSLFIEISWSIVVANIVLFSLRDKQEVQVRHRHKLRTTLWRRKTSTSLRIKTMMISCLHNGR